MRKTVGILLGMLALAAHGADRQVNGVRLWSAPENSRVVLDLSAPAEHTLLRLSNPDRLVIDLENTRMNGALPAPEVGDALLAGLRSGMNQNTLRFVLDLKKPVRAKTLVLPPNQQYGHRLVIDLLDEQPATATPVPARPAPSRPAAPNERRDLIIAIDAGHGGEDPGAIGYRGTREKDVVLAIARRLEALVAAEPGMKPVMIRRGDYFLSLKERREAARRAHADLLVSIHADAWHDKRARGSSVFVLSERGASTAAAKILADQENASDLIGGVSLDDMDDQLKSVILDLSQTGTIIESLEVGSEVLGALGGVNQLHKHRVEQAGFAVLKAPNVPSILVETAFLSNPSEERKLNDPQQQDLMARAVFQGVRGYFARRAPSETSYAAAGNQHRVRSGETLSSIARLYNVPMAALRATNNMADNLLRVGDLLQIPATMNN